MPVGSTQDGPQHGHVSSETWQPLSARLGGSPIDSTWQDGIPAWIDRAVRDWLQVRLISTHERLFARLHYPGHFDFDNRFSLVDSLNEPDLLDWIDGVLNVHATKHREHGLPASFLESDARDLQALLREGHSIWKVSDTFDGLERRQESTVTAAAHRASETARSFGRPASAEHLEKAWRHTYGLHPEPSKAFGEAVLAVEAVAVPAIVPAHAGAHLGHVYGQLSRQGSLYDVVISDRAGNPSSVEPVTQLVGLLWHGHTDRHEGNEPAIPITQEAAEMALHTATTLVQWFSSGCVRRVR